MNNDNFTFCSLIEGGQADVRVSSWDCGLNIEKLAEGQWIPIDYDPYMIVLRGEKDSTESPYVFYDKRDDIPVSHEILEHFKKTVPKRIQRIVECFHYAQLNMLKALRYCPELISLAESCPPLFWIIVTRYPLTDTNNVGELKKTVFRKRKDILYSFGFIGTKSSVRFLEKIVISTFRAKDLFFLQKILSSEKGLKNLRHFNVISRPHLIAGGGYPELLGYKFIRKDLMDPETASMFLLRVVLLEDVKRMAELLHKQGVERILHNIKSSSQLSRYHDSLVALLKVAGLDGQSQDLMEKYGKSFFNPPIPGNHFIKPITSLAGLLKEANLMQHCVASYGKDIYEGKYYCYKILAPERATLALDLRERPMKILQIQLKNNKQPSPRTINIVRKWLTDYYEMIYSI